jgi:hypothetical protein
VLGLLRLRLAVVMGWRTEVRQDITRCSRHAGLARADAARSRKYAAGTAEESERDNWLESAQFYDRSAEQFDRVTEDYRALLREYGR